MKKIYFDCETTGVNPIKNDIIQIAGIIEIDGKQARSFNYTCQPFNYDNISPEALGIHGMGLDQIKTFDTPQSVYGKLIGMFDLFVNKYNKSDKFIVCGYNVKFDIDFLNQFFKKAGNDYLFSYFGTVKDPLPILNYLKSLDKFESENLKLSTVCELFNVKIENAHDAMADIEATKALIEKVDKLMAKIKI